MSDLKSELAQHALMAANKIKRDSESDTEASERAYERAKSFDELPTAKCPICWVWEGKIVELNVTARTSEVSEYTCDKCEFQHVFPTPEAN